MEITVVIVAVALISMGMFPVIVYLIMRHENKAWDDLRKRETDLQYRIYLSDMITTFSELWEVTCEKYGEDSDEAKRSKQLFDDFCETNGLSTKPEQTA